MKRNIDESKLIDKNSSDDKLKSDNKPDFKILAPKKVAKILGIHPTTVTRLAKSGQLKSYLIGRGALVCSDFRKKITFRSIFDTSRI